MFAGSGRIEMQWFAPKGRCSPDWAISSFDCRARNNMPVCATGNQRVIEVVSAHIHTQQHCILLRAWQLATSKPMQNEFVEHFKGRPRDETLLMEARWIEEWRINRISASTDYTSQVRSTPRGGRRDRFGALGVPKCSPSKKLSDTAGYEDNDRVFPSLFRSAPNVGRVSRPYP